MAGERRRRQDWMLVYEKKQPEQQQQEQADVAKQAEQHKPSKPQKTKEELIELKKTRAEKRRQLNIERNQKKPDQDALKNASSQQIQKEMLKRKKKDVNNLQKFKNLAWEDGTPQAAYITNQPLGTLRGLAESGVIEVNRQETMQQIISGTVVGGLQFVQLFVNTFSNPTMSWLASIQSLYTNNSPVQIRATWVSALGTDTDGEIYMAYQPDVTQPLPTNVNQMTGLFGRTVGNIYASGIKLHVGKKMLNKVNSTYIPAAQNATPVANNTAGYIVVCIQNGQTPFTNGQILGSIQLSYRWKLLSPVPMPENNQSTLQFCFNDGGQGPISLTGYTKPCSLSDRVVVEPVLIPGQQHEINLKLSNRMQGFVVIRSTTSGKYNQPPVLGPDNSVTVIWHNIALRSKEMVIIALVEGPRFSILQLKFEDQCDFRIEHSVLFTLPVSGWNECRKVMQRNLGWDIPRLCNDDPCLGYSQQVQSELIARKMMTNGGRAEIAKTCPNLLNPGPWYSVFTNAAKAVAKFAWPAAQTVIGALKTEGKHLMNDVKDNLMGAVGNVVGNLVTSFSGAGGNTSLVKGGSHGGASISGMALVNQIAMNVQTNENDVLNVESEEAITSAYTAVPINQPLCPYNEELCPNLAIKAASYTYYIPGPIQISYVGTVSQLIQGNIVMGYDPDSSVDYSNATADDIRLLHNHVEGPVSAVMALIIPTDMQMMLKTFHTVDQTQLSIYYDPTSTQAQRNEFYKYFTGQLLIRTDGDIPNNVDVIGQLTISYKYSFNTPASIQEVKANLAQPQFITSTTQGIGCSGATGQGCNVPFSRWAAGQSGDTNKYSNPAYMPFIASTSPVASDIWTTYGTPYAQSRNQTIYGPNYIQLIPSTLTWHQNFTFSNTIDRVTAPPVNTSTAQFVFAQNFNGYVIFSGRIWKQQTNATLPAILGATAYNAYEPTMFITGTVPTNDTSITFGTVAPMPANLSSLGTGVSLIDRSAYPVTRALKYQLSPSLTAPQISQMLLGTQTGPVSQSSYSTQAGYINFTSIYIVTAQQGDFSCFTSPCGNLGQPATGQTVVDLDQCGQYLDVELLLVPFPNGIFSKDGLQSTKQFSKHRDTIIANRIDHIKPHREYAITKPIKQEVEVIQGYTCDLTDDSDQDDFDSIGDDYVKMQFNREGFTTYFTIRRDQVEKFSKIVSYVGPTRQEILDLLQRDGIEQDPGPTFITRLLKLLFEQEGDDEDEPPPP